MTPEELFSDDNIISYIADKTNLDNKVIKKILDIGNEWFQSMLGFIVQAHKDATALNVDIRITQGAIDALESLRFERINSGDDPDPDDVYIDRIANLTNLPKKTIIKVGAEYLHFFEEAFESYDNEKSRESTSD